MSSLLPYALSDRYKNDTGRVFMTGIQALVRLAMMQRQLDKQRGLNTAGLISGYRGSPLGGYDQEIWRSQKHLEAHDIDFEPGINEDLGASILWGVQMIDYYREDATKDGVFCYWYGKAHGVDRSMDVFRQANIQGTAKHGGVLAFIGDDHAAESSMFSHQTDQVLESAIMPVLFPSSVEEYLSLGLLGMEMSRFSGLWCGFKTITETVESASSFNVPGLPEIVTPDIDVPPHGFNYDVTLHWPAERMEFERRMVEERVPAAHAFAYANGIDRTFFKSSQKRLGIVTTGKAHGDFMQALRLLGLDYSTLEALGISIFKVGMSWPLEPRAIRDFGQDMRSLLVVEEKRPQLEKQIKEQLYNWPADGRPQIVGKRDQEGQVLLPEIWVFTPEIVAKAISKWLTDLGVDTATTDQFSSKNQPLKRSDKLIARTPYFCAGCPHNRSTKVPDGSVSGAGIGCHIMVLGQGRRTETFTHMGGEGMHWVGLHRYSKRDHMFQNLGDGTYQHSGSLAIRQAVVSGTNITYKILYNDAVAMVGGQPVDGMPSPGMIAQQLFAEGVKRVALVSDDIDKYQSDTSLPQQTERHDRDALDQVQRDFRETEGVSVIIYEQTCAAEKRRRRKRGLLKDPARRLFINDRVCEGCGDCSVQSNCIAIEPKETDFGRKRQINQSSCNKDYSCVNGFCPSFVSVIGGTIRKPDGAAVAAVEDELLANLPDVPHRSLDAEYTVLLAGIGGLGVLTIGGILSMAAHLEGKGTTTLDFTGLSQKNGAVTAHVKLAPTPKDIHVARISDQGADLLLGCDMIAALPSAVKIGQDRTRAVINSAEVPVAVFTRNNDMYFPARESLDVFSSACGKGHLNVLDATMYAEKLFGDTLATNMMMVGYAFQKGLIPLSQEAIHRAIELNGVAIDLNTRAFAWGRVAAHRPGKIDTLINTAKLPKGDDVTLTLPGLVARFREELILYQNEAYAQRYEKSVQSIMEAERAALGKAGALSESYARNLYKLMAYKDEYEVARLYSQPEFKASLEEQFQGDYTLQFHLAPPLISKTDQATGRPKKRTFGPWVLPAFKMLSKMKKLRGTALDIFGYTAERRRERQLIEDYETLAIKATDTLTAENYKDIKVLLDTPTMIRGYGPLKEENVAKANKAQRALLAKLAHPKSKAA